MMMIEEKVDASLEDMVCIGTIGHVDHGKTSLTSAITRVLGCFLAYDKIDDTKEEIARGITINAKHVKYKTRARVYTHVDCPGHEDYIKNMIVGSSQLDIAILVVCLSGGAEKQTTEHLNLISNIGVPSLVIFFNKADVVDDPIQIQMVVEEVLEYAAKYGYKNVPYVIGSAVMAKDDEEHHLNQEGKLVDKNNNLIPEDSKAQLGIPRVMELMNIVDTLPLRPRDHDKPFWISVEQVVSITGRGTVATGRVRRGIVKLNDSVDIMSGGLGQTKGSTTVTSIEIYGVGATQARPGHDAAFLLRGIDKKAIRRGMVLAAPNSVKETKRFRAYIYVISKEDKGRSTGFKATYKPQFFIHSADVTGSFEKMESLQGHEVDFVNPGECINAIVHLTRKVCLEVNDKFIIRESNMTVAAGKVLMILE